MDRASGGSCLRNVELLNCFPEQARGVPF